MKRVLKKVTAALLAATMVVGLLHAETVEVLMTRAARAVNQERLKSEFLSVFNRRSGSQCKKMLDAAAKSTGCRKYSMLTRDMYLRKLQLL